MQKPPFNLGYPSDTAQSNYYLYDGPHKAHQLTKTEIRRLDAIMERVGIEPENTRLCKIDNGDDAKLQILLASALPNVGLNYNDTLQDEPDVSVIRGDHDQAMAKVCQELEHAIAYASNETQEQVLRQYIESFRTGDMNAYRESQKLWVTDKSPAVENTIGFVEMYRDPAGLRAEWQGIVCIADKEETLRLNAFVAHSTDFIRTLPWAVPNANDGQGPFEKDSFEKPDFTIVHGTLDGVH